MSADQQSDECQVVLIKTYFIHIKYVIYFYHIEER